METQSKNKSHKGIVYYVLVAVLILAVLMEILPHFYKNEELPLTAITEQATPNADTKDKNNYKNSVFMQTMIKALTENNVNQELYSLISPYKNTKPTQAEVQQYIKILHESLGRNILSYTPMAKKERDRYLNQIKKNNPAYVNQIEDALFYWLELAPGQNSYNRFPLIIWQNENNQPTLYQKWLTDSYRLYSYFNLYLKTIEGEETAALTTMLNLYNDKDTAEKQADATIDFYRKLNIVKNKGVKSSKNLKITSLRADLIEVENKLPLELAYTSDFLNNLTSEEIKQAYHYTQIKTINHGDDLEIIDIIPEQQSQTSLSLMKDQMYLISIDQPVDNYTIHRIFGNWTEAFFYPDALDSSNGEISIKLPKLELTIQGTYNSSNHSFTGNIKSITFSNPYYNLTDGLKIGSTYNEVQKLHPFLYMNNNRVSYLDGSIQYQFSNSEVTEITIAKD